MVFFKREDPEVDELGGLELFSGLSRKELAAVAERAQRISMRSGEIVMLERFHGEQFLVILDGSVEVTLEGKKVATLGVGDFVGEMGLMRDADRAATVVAATDVKFLAFGAEAFEEMTRELPEVGERIREVMRIRTEELESR